MDNEQAKQIIRRLESIEKTLNIVHKDRDILEDISIRVGRVEDEMRYLKERVAKLEKNITADIKDIHDVTDDLMEQMKEGE